MKLIYLAGMLLAMNSCIAQSPGSLKTNADDNSLLWEVSGNGLSKPSYLFGTFHLLCKDDIKFSDALKQAVNNSSVIYMELDMDDPATILGGLKMMNMKEGKKLKDLFTPDEYKRVETFFRDSLQTPIGIFQNMKPLLLMAMIYPKLLPCNSISGVEEELLNLAREKDKEVFGLETLAFQSSVFDSIPYKTQAVEMLKTIDSLEKSKLYFDSMMVAYTNQDMRLMETLMNNPDFGMEENQDILLDNRNKNWVDQLKTIMKKNSAFIAVGTGHLIGKTGLIALLRMEGYTVRPLENRNK